MTTVVVDSDGRVGLPDEVLAAGRIGPGTELVVVAEAGRLILVDTDRLLRERIEAKDAEIRGRLRQALEHGGREHFFGGLGLDEYLSLSEEEDEVLWDRLYAEAEREVNDIETDVPARFRPAGQGNRSRSTARRRAH